jgi:DNA-binding winged helix-turn-helix (wHTH) protein
VELRHLGETVALEPRVFDVLAYLVHHRDRVVPKEELLDEVWGDRFVSESALSSCIRHVRRALGDDGTAQRFVRTAHGRGYRFVAHVASAEVGAGTGPWPPVEGLPVAGPSGTCHRPERTSPGTGSSLKAFRSRSVGLGR